MKKSFLLFSVLFAVSLFSNTFHLVTYASHCEEGLIKLLRSCKHTGNQITILGMGKPYGGNTQRLLEYKQYLSTLPEEDIVMCIDAFDVLLCERAKQLVDGFHSFNAPLVFSSSTVCWPHYHLGQFFDSVDSKFKYLNGGGYVGYVKRLNEMLEDLSPIQIARSDQAILIPYYLKHKQTIALDNYCRLFLPLRAVKRRELAVSRKQKKVQYRPFGHFSGMIHGHGQGRTTYSWLVSQLYGQQATKQEMQDYLQDDSVITNYEEIRETLSFQKQL